MRAPDDAQVARFRRDLEEVSGGPPSSDRLLGIAVSGGADSVALLLLAAAAYPGSVVAATVDHGLRPESASEAIFVAEICQKLGVPHDSLTIAPGSLADGNLQEQARNARYAVLRLWGGSGMSTSQRPWRVEAVATAHQQNDVAEGFLMRARRGAGVGGLAAMAANHLPGNVPGPNFIRPLLGWSRRELADIVEAANITAIRDPSNAYRRFDRSRIRQLIASSPDLPADRLALAAQNLRHAETALQWVAAREWEVRSEIVDRETLWLDVAGLPYELRRRLVSRAIDYVRSQHALDSDWRGTGLDRLVTTLDLGQHGTLAGIAARAGPRWRFKRASPRRSH